MTKSIIRHSMTVGNGADINIELGFIPNSVEVYNATDGDLLTVGYLSPWVVPFTSGGLNATSGLNVETVAGSTIRAPTSGATATVASVLVYSGTFAAGDAAGFFTLQEGSLTGTFGSETVVTNPSSGVVTTATGLDATVTANVVHNYASAAAIAGATTTSAIARYAGSAGSASQGFTIGSVVAEEAKVLRWRAFRDDA